jgi:putative SOS response-associated peptidase YedK
MCYDIKTKLESMLKRARYRNDEARIAELLEQLEPYSFGDIFHASGFAHPTVLIYTNKNPDIPTPSVWGLVPSWVKGEEQLNIVRNRTLNARGETIFEKSSFRHSARQKRCLIYLDGFYEHHHFDGKKYPFLISRKNGEAMAIAGLWSEWIDRQTGEVLNSFSIVTTTANPMMALIHNNPKLPEPRMPAILEDERADDWLGPCHNDHDQSRLLDMLEPFYPDVLHAHPVTRLRGKEALGNIKEASEEVKYKELDLKF